MAAQDKLSLIGIITAGTIGSVLGSLPLYYGGRLLGEERLKEIADKYGRWLTISRKDIGRAKRWFDRHGGLAVLICRLVPGIRSLISIPAGVARMNLASFLLYTFIGTPIWTALLAYLGYFLGSNFGEIGQYLDSASWVVLAGIVVIYCVRAIRQKGNRSAKGAAS
jgi:membrane protein DedA with SNARE-associated domain